MFVKQISVFLENRHGRLADFTKVLAEGGVDMIALSVADTSDFGIVRTIVTDTDRAVKTLREAGYTVTITDVLAVAVPDEPGGLNEAVRLLSENSVSIEYIYSFVRNVQDRAVIIFRVDKPLVTYELLKSHGAMLLDQKDINQN